jgi:N-acetylglucosaminyldiphosphoundecaprenol N-acetyl-beta-D-mannosaminyltransferase
VHDGYFDSSLNAEENAAVLQEIALFRPNVLLVGMGMPRQEIWILENLACIRSNTVFCCGALIDYVAGELATPPRWLGQIGLEWLYRLIVEPSRLWRRYLLEPWTVFRVVAKEWMTSTRRKAPAVSGNGPVS